MFCALNVLGGSVQFNPAFACHRFDAEFRFEQRQIARLVIEQLLREPRVLVMKSFSCHN